MSVHLNVGTAIDEINSYHVKTARLVEEMPARQEVCGHLPDSALLHTCNGGGASTKIVARTGFHLDEDDVARLARDDVNFAEPGAVPAFKNCVPAPP